MARNSDESWLDRLHRIAKYRLVVPLKRSKKPVAYKARGVAVGLFWAMTPLVGIQMPLVFVTWLVMRQNPRWDFHLIIAFAWTWVSNIFTMLPMYYFFYITGQFMLLRWDDLAGYHGFKALFVQVLAVDNTFFQKVQELLTLIAKEQGLAMLVGCMPWAILCTWLGYKWSLAYLIRHHEKRFKKPEPAPEAADKGAEQT